MKRMKHTPLFSKALALTLCLAMALSCMGFTATAAAYDPAKEYATTGLSFTTEQPDLRFYINAAAKWELANIPTLGFGTTAGEWTAMDLLRGLYTGGDYINNISSTYFSDYIGVFEQKMIDTKGQLHRVKYTEYSRLMLALSSLGYDVHNVAPHYRDGDYSGTVVDGATAGATAYSYDIPLIYSVKNSTLYKQGINGPIWVLIAMNTGGYAFYTKDQIQAGMDGTNAEIAKKLAAYAPSQMFLKDPDTSAYTVIEAEDPNFVEASGIRSPKGVATEGKQIEYILSREITQTDGTVGGWALTGSTPDPDITGMALQALAPYYLDEARFNAAKNGAYYDDTMTFAYTYAELKSAVERAVLVMSQKQLANGGFSSWGTTNSESVAQVIVALTELGMDPMGTAVSLPTLNTTCSFIKAGEERDGVTTNNMIDNILTFWAKESGSTADVGGFKHVTTGADGGGGSGTDVNAMATDQALYALIAYDRYLNGKNKLYDMTDMTGGEYASMKAKACTLTYDMNGQGKAQSVDFSAYGTTVAVTPADTADYRFTGWNTKADGTGIAIAGGSTISLPGSSVTLYAVWTLNSEIAASVDAVISKINAIGTVTLSSESAIQAARALYTALPDAHKSLVTNYQTLVAAEAALLALQTGPKPVTDSATNVVVVLDPTVVPADTTIVVSPWSKGTPGYSKVAAALQAYGSQFTAYDITLYSSNVQVQPNGTVQVKLPVPSGFAQDKIKVVKVLPDGTVKEYACTVENGYAVFVTDSFSTYAIVQANGGTSSAPQTGDAATPALWAAALLASMVLGGLAFYKKHALEQ